MSKEANNLRLLGSPVNLSYRGKKKDEKRNIRNRPRSALQSTVCITPVYQEKYKRPFSADTKDRAPSTRSFLKSFSAELLQSYNNSPATVRIVAPTTDLLRDTKSIETESDKNKIICSNLSDYGSEDTFISLGTKIKAKAQLASKNKINSKNFVKYRNLAKKARKPMENTISEDDINNQEYDLQVKIIERVPSPSSENIMFHGRSINLSKYKHKNARDIFEEYFSNKHLVTNKKGDFIGVDESSRERSVKSEEARESHAGCLSVAKQQLSLVEEESTQDLDSLPSQHLSSLPLEISLEDKITKIDLNRTYPTDKKSQWTEPLNHSRLLYKDFFLKKEGHIALPPQNSPNKSDIHIPGSSEVTDEVKPDNADDNLDYPPYLINSTTKAYTSKVIEDYKKELEAINNLHDLTIKDIKTDAVSPTPLNIDKMFEDASNFEDKKDCSESSQDSNITDRSSFNKNSLESKQDISKISTKELIQNYLKVKEGDYKNAPKITKKPDRKVTNGGSGENSASSKQAWNNKSSKSGNKSPIPVNIRNQTQKNMFTMPPRVMSWIDGLQNDKDVDSWMSLTAPSPRVLEMEEVRVEESRKSETPRPEERVEIARPPSPARSEGKQIQPPKELGAQSTVLDIYSMLKEIESYGDNPVTAVTNNILNETETKKDEETSSPKDNFMEIFEFLEKVEQSANDALSVVTNTTPQTMPKLETLLKLPQTELAQRLVTASLQLEERSCCIALLQESLANHKEQMINKVSNLEKQSIRNINKVKQDCEETIKRHQNFIDQLINDKKTLNHRIEQLVDERRALEERWKRSAQALEERYKLELRNQHDKMQAAQQVARQRWVRQKAEKIKELTVKGLEGELREMAERQQKEVSDLKMMHAEQSGRIQAKHAQELEELRRTLEEEKEAALVKERHLASSRLEKQILEIELTYQEQRTRLVSEMRAENERVAAELAAREKAHREEMEKWREEQEKEIKEKRMQMELEIAAERHKIQEQMNQKDIEMQQQLEEYKKQLEVEQQAQLKRKVAEISAQHKQERDREIERAIESMEAEAQAGRRELQDALRRNKEQYEAELKELAETEQATLRRYQDAQARVRQTEDRCAELEVTISQLETRNRILTEKNTQLETRAEEIRTSCEESWKSQVDTLKKEMEDMKKTHEEQMHQLYAKVKVAVARKDSAIQALTREAAKYQEKITILEQKLQQQRKDFLKQK